jgi:hypothetical protein
MLNIPFNLLLIINATLLIFAFILASLLLRLGVLYVRSIGDDARQSTQKKLILTMIMLLLFASLAAAIFNILITP